MSTKHNTTHPSRGKSNYKKRLKKRGLSVAPRLPSLYELRNKSDARLYGKLITKQEIDEVRNLGKKQ